MKYDIIIIGGGLGGLTAGAKLSREGKKVLLIEQHDRPGGCATTFRKGEFTLEVGLHEIDGPGPVDLKTKLFNELGLFDKVEFIKLPEFYHFVNDNIRITIPHDPHEAATILKNAFPEEEKGIDSFYSQVLNPKKRGLAGEEPAGEMSVGEFLDSIISNEDLKLVLLGNLGYFHDDPYSLSLTYYCAAQSRYFNGGASYIKGGSQVLSDFLADYINSHGGKVLLNHLVTGFITGNGEIRGVRCIKKNKRGEKMEEAWADEIIANASMPGIASILPEDKSKILFGLIGDKRPGASLLTVYFGFDTMLSDLGNNHYSTFVYDGSVKSQKDILINNKGDFEKRSYTFVDYGQVDQTLADGGKSVGALCCIDYPGNWENLTREEYNSRKEEVAQIFIRRLESIVPGISGRIIYHEVATPLTIKRYTLNPEGAVYGFEQLPFNMPVDTSSVAGNLHFASAWTRTGGGFSGAIYSGYFCALSILRKKQAVK